LEKIRVLSREYFSKTKWDIHSVLAHDANIWCSESGLDSSCDDIFWDLARTLARIDKTILFR